jgi:hypothetical protein
MGGAAAHKPPASLPSIKAATGTKDYQQSYLTSFFSAVLTDAGLPVNGTNIAVLEGQTQEEGSSATYNPLDLEVGVPSGGSAYNSQGVTNFANTPQGETQGEQATAKVLLQKNMAALANALRGNTGTSSTPDYQAAAATARTGLGGSDWLGGGAGSAANQAYGEKVANLVGLQSVAGDKGATGIQAAADAVPASIADPLSSIGSLEGQVGTLLGDFTSVSFWIRIGLVVLGFVLLIVGVKALAASGGSDLREGQPAPQAGPVDKAAKKTVEVGAVA